jgi:hypothetical protein
MTKQKIYEVTETVYGYSLSTVTLKGTMEELLETTKHAFRVGHTWDSSINLNPKTIKGFVSNYKKALGQALGRYVEITYAEVKA